MHRAADGRFISFFGDLHPSFAGNVVKAMGGAKHGYPVVTPHAGDAQRPSQVSPTALIARLPTTSCAPRVHAVNRLTPTIVEVVVHAPAAARAPSSPASSIGCRTTRRWSHARPTAPVLAMEGLAMTGAWVDPSAGPAVG